MGGTGTSSGKKKKAVARTAKLFQNGRSQAVRLPKEFRFEGTEVRIRRTKKGVLLEESSATPMRPGGDRKAEVARWFADLDRFNEVAGEFMPEGREQPPMPKQKFPPEW